VLVDLDDAMFPFRRDQDELIAQMKNLIVDGLLVVRTFERDPFRVLSEMSVESIRFPQPPPRVPVLALTDLGIQERRRGSSVRATTSRWLSFAADLRRGGIPLLALVPYPPRLWPPELVGKLSIAQWDRPATVSAVKRAASAARKG
jgi:hypothetical protein